jgi:F0F1-type ATP synthase membrane subunit b/b'
VEIVVIVDVMVAVEMVDAIVNKLNMIKKTYIYLIIIFIVFISILVYFFYSKYTKISKIYQTNDKQIIGTEKNNNNNEDLENVQVEKKDTFAELKKTEEFQKIEELSKSGDFTDVKESLEKLAEETPNKKGKEAVELYSAYLLMQTNKDEGVEFYKKIYLDVANSKINRAYALLKVEQYSKGERKIEYVLPFLTESERKSLKTDLEIYNAVDNKIYALYPFAISAARIGKYEIELNKNIETAEKIYKLYKDSLVSGSLEMLKYEGLRHLAGNTNMNHAQLWAELEEFKVVDPKETQKIFENAFENAKLYSPRGTLQFIVLAYADYNSKRGNLVKTEKLIEFLTTEKLDKNVVNSLNLSKKTGSYLGIQKFYKDKKKFPTFFAQFGW